MLILRKPAVVKTPAPAARAPRSQDKKDLERKRINGMPAQWGTTSMAPVCNGASREPYQAPELRPFIGRPGAMHAYTLPSRVNQRRTWPDGRVTELTCQPNPQKASHE